MAEQSVLYRKIPTRSDTRAVARSPPPLQPLSCSAWHTHFNLKSEPQVPCVLKSLLLWHPPSLGLSSFASPTFPQHPAASLGMHGSAMPHRERQERERLPAGAGNLPGLTWSPPCPAAGFALLAARSVRGEAELFSECLHSTFCPQPPTKHAGP